MNVNVLGGGPAGLYAGILLKKGHPEWAIRVFERNPRGATFGWGVVFSDRTLAGMREADARTYTAITESFVLWEAIDIRFRERLVRCAGHAFAGIARRRLLDILGERCAELGVEVEFECEVDDVAELARADLLVAADGVNTKVRAWRAEDIRPRVTDGRTRFIWFGTDKVYDAFTFLFRENEHGLFQVHAYPFDATTSTFIVECAADTWRRAGLDEADEAASLTYCERLFADHLDGRRLLSNHSRWLTFLTLTNRRWSSGNTVLLGDAAHTAHFSIGSGTKLALEDAIALAAACEEHANLSTALRHYEQARKPRVEALQRAAAESQHYFEQVGRYRHFPPWQFAFHLLTRSGRITFDNLRQRDPHFVAAVERRFAANHDDRPGERRFAPPPLFTPLALRGVTLANRAVLAGAPVEDAVDGLPGAATRADLLAKARGGAGLVLTAPVAVSARGRITPGDAGLYDPAHAAAWADLIAAIHAESSAQVALRLGHAGRRGATRPRARGLDRPLKDGGWPLLAPSALPYGPGSAVPVVMGCADLEAAREEFARAAHLAGDAGADVLVLDAAHGYLLGSFLSPLANGREDDYGGSAANRLRFPLEVLDCVRAAWPADRPLAVTLSASDWARGGLDLAGAVAIARAFKECGCDLVAVYAGQTVPDEQPHYDVETFNHYSDVIRNEAGVATLATGYLTTSDGLNTLLAGGRADLGLFYPSDE
ncbi:MAG TPA: FAD-dependent monooxygenase [Thermomicrobiales bacterium]|nr:FAD-dependent monooxygenase [Thermomicrobiales bacterium]